MSNQENQIAAKRLGLSVVPLVIGAVILPLKGPQYLSVWGTGLSAAILASAWMAWVLPKGERSWTKGIVLFVLAGAVFALLAYVDVESDRRTAESKAKWAEVGLLPPKFCMGGVDDDGLLTAYKAGKPIGGWCRYRALPGKELPAALATRPRIQYDCGKLANTVGRDLAAQGYDISGFCTTVTEAPPSN